MTKNSDWGEVERINIYTIVKKTLHKKSFYADVDAEDVAPPTYELVNCKIDGFAVDIEEYTSEKELYFVSAEYWSLYGDSREETTHTIWEIGAAAGIDPAEIAVLLNSPQ